MKNLIFIILLSLIFLSCSVDNPSEPSSYSPEISITSPTNGLVLNKGEVLTVNVEADDEDGTINEVRLYIDNLGIESDATFPYQFSIQTENLNYGLHNIKVIAEDNDGNESSDSLAIDIYTPIMFDRTYGSENITSGNSILKLTDGYIVLGSTGDSTNTDISLMKIDLNGEVLWNKTYTNFDSLGNPYNDVGHSFIQTQDGGYLIVGETNYTAWIIKTDSDGNELWNKIYVNDMGFPNCANDIIQNTDGGYMIVGYMIVGKSDYNVWAMKIDSVGGVIWEKSYDDYIYMMATNIQETQSGGFIICGHAFILNVDIDGNTLWSDFVINPFDIIQTDDGGYITLGEYDDVTYLNKFDAVGNELWEKTINESSGTSFQIIDGGYIICGSIDNDGLLIKTDSDGNEVWRRIYGGAEFDIFNNIQLTSDGYIITGENNSSGVDSGLWLVKTDKYGYIN